MAHDLQALIVGILKELHNVPIKFYPTHRRLTGKLTSAVLLAYLLRQFQYHQRTTIFYTDKEIMEGTTLTPNELRGAKEEIKEKVRFVSITREGVDGKTHYSVDWFGYCDQLREEKTSYGLVKSTNPGLVKSTKPNASVSLNPLNPSLLRKHTQIQNNMSHPANAEGGTAIGGIESKWKRLAVILAETVWQVYHVDHRKRASQWARSLRLMEESDKIPFFEVKAKLLWYCAELPRRRGVNYFPDIQSGPTFREKWIKVLNAMDRAKKEASASRNGDGHSDDDSDSGGRVSVRSRCVGTRMVDGMSGEED